MDNQLLFIVIIVLILFFMYNSSTKSVKQPQPQPQPHHQIPMVEPSPNVIGIATANKVVGTGVSQSGLRYSSKCDVFNNNCNIDYRIVYQDIQNGMSTNGSEMTIFSSGLMNPEIEFAITDMYNGTGNVNVILQGRYYGDSRWLNVEIPSLIFPRGANKATIRFSGNTSRLVW